MARSGVSGSVAHGGDRRRRSVVGWVDADATAEWLGHDEVNVGYAVFSEHRRHGHAARALRLFVERIAGSTPILVIDRDNVASHAVARRAGARLLTDRVIDRFPTSLVYAFIPGHLENSA